MFRTYIPQAPLADFVEMFWIYDEPLLTLEKERFLPSGAVEILINLCEDTFRVYDPQKSEQCQKLNGCLLCGVHSSYSILDLTCMTPLIGTPIMGMRFKPGGAYPFMNIPVSELHNRHLPLDTLWGSAASHLREQLLKAQTPQSRFLLLEQALLAQACRPLALHPAVSFALRELQTVPHTRTISEIAEDFGLSLQWFIQVFRQEVGLTPKLFCRIQRFYEVLHRCEKKHQVEWAELALHCGYFDQAHFNHDFRAFSGLTPSSYLERRGHHLRHFSHIG